MSMCESLRYVANWINTKNTTLSSKTLMCNFCSEENQVPYAINSPHVAPQPTRVASVKIFIFYGNQKGFPLVRFGMCVHQARLSLVCSGICTFNTVFRIIWAWYGLRRCWSALECSLAYCIVSIVEIIKPINLAKVINDVKTPWIVDEASDLIILALS